MKQLCNYCIKKAKYKRQLSFYNRIGLELNEIKVCKEHRNQSIDKEQNNEADKSNCL